MSLECSGCHEAQPKALYSRAQLKKGGLRRCEACVASPPAPAAAPPAAAPPTLAQGKAMLPLHLAAQVVAGVEAGGGMRTVLYGLPMPERLRPTVIALASATLQHRDALLRAVSSARLPCASPSLRALALVLVHEMVLRRRRVKGSARDPLARAVWERRDALHQQLLPPAEAPPAPRAAEWPRYARVNPLRGMTSGAAIEALRAAGGPEAAEDPLVRGLLRLPPRASLHGHPLVRAAKLIPQDRASCLPALALSPPVGAAVVDSCAAPGNKTTQLAALVGASGKVFAFERNGARAATLREQVARAGAAAIVRVLHADFLAAAAGGAWREARWALCDPSCSGSGGAGGHFRGEKGEEEYWAHVAKLARAQVAIVCKAMSFPAMQTVVYSTCSVHRQENEDVVAQVLELQRGGWKLVRCLPEWPTRGLSAAPHGELCVRASEQDETHGFFVARFERVAASDSTRGDLEAATKGVNISQKRKRCRSVDDAVVDAEVGVHKDTSESLKTRNSTLTEERTSSSQSSKRARSQKKPSQQWQQKRGLSDLGLVDL
ncbi:hypothetical protein AB1Y20_023244 [Prymnesium parvum]|uniref:SAM-dependent MTase RsmB/NOP-type domain-containing protein n=1 Tax=Prymnesium parvum TaxID=97485 RepID=A0AB34JG71_PRYPA